MAGDEDLHSDLIRVEGFADAALRLCLELCECLAVPGLVGEADCDADLHVLIIGSVWRRLERFCTPAAGRGRMSPPSYKLVTSCASLKRWVMCLPAQKVWS
jgi:hypothetical protein